MTTDKVKEVQEYLEKKGIVVAETTIIDAAIKIATRWGGNAVFISEFENEGKKMKKTEIIRTIDPDALWVLCQEFDKKEGYYPEHIYEGAAVFTFFTKIITEEGEMKRGVKQ